EGEAYFEVAKDPQHPFHVNARNGVNIEVLGTSFNVRSYTDENAIETVLEEGSVRMSQGKDAVILSPGNKAVYLPNEPIQLTTVNTELYTAWRHGQYIFMEESVENILKQLSRWYDIEVFYSNEAAKSVVFSGDVRKYDDINTLLEAMEIAGGIHFRINGKTLIVSYSE
ncbi:MAG TPA: iron dicitrate transport regulator FecR, partial [Butyricimonas virosa]|nr:iron dicitrate transport regulator FecR [Butyricimonas virosa]